MGPISESHLEGVHPKDVSSALRIQSGSACFLQIFVKSVVTFFIKTWQGNLMMRIISDGKGGHWGRCGAKILCYAVLMMWSATGWLGSYSSPSDIQRLFTIPERPREREPPSRSLRPRANEEVALSFGMHGANAKLMDPSHDRSPRPSLYGCAPHPHVLQAERASIGAYRI